MAVKPPSSTSFTSVLLFLILALVTTATTARAAWDRNPATFCVGSPFGANFSNASALPDGRNCGTVLAAYASTSEMRQISEHCCKGSPKLNLDCVCGPGRVFNSSGMMSLHGASGPCDRRLLEYAVGHTSPAEGRAPPRTCEALRDAFNVSSDTMSGEKLGKLRAFCCSEPPAAAVSCMCPGGASNARFDEYLTNAARGTPGTAMTFEGITWRSCPQAFDYILTTSDVPASGGSFTYVTRNTTTSCNTSVAAMPPPACKPQDHAKEDNGTCSAYTTQGTCGGAKYNAMYSCSVEMSPMCVWNATSGKCAVSSTRWFKHPRYNATRCTSQTAMDACVAENPFGADGQVCRSARGEERR